MTPPISRSAQFYLHSSFKENVICSQCRPITEITDLVCQICFDFYNIHVWASRVVWDLFEKRIQFRIHQYYKHNSLACHIFRILSLQAYIHVSIPRASAGRVRRQNAGHIPCIGTLRGICLLRWSDALPCNSYFVPDVHGMLLLSQADGNAVRVLSVVSYLHLDILCQCQVSLVHRMESKNKKFKFEIKWSYPVVWWIGVYNIMKSIFRPCGHVLVFWLYGV